MPPPQYVLIFCGICRPPSILCEGLLLGLDHLHTLAVVGEIVFFTYKQSQDLCPMFNRPALRVSAKSISVWRTYFLPLLHDCCRNSITIPEQEIEIDRHQFLPIRSQSKSRYLQRRPSKSRRSLHCCALNFTLAILTELPIFKCVLAKYWRGIHVSPNVLLHSNHIVNSCKLTVQVLEFPLRSASPFPTPKVIRWRPSAITSKELSPKFEGSSPKAFLRPRRTISSVAYSRNSG